MRTCLVLLAAASLALLVQHARGDVVELRDGTILRGRKTAESPTTIGFRTQEGEFRVLSKGNIKAYRAEDVARPPKPEPPKPLPGAEPATKAIAEPPAKGESLEELLGKRTVSFDFVEKPLADVVSFVASETGMPIALDAAELGGPHKVTLRVDNMPVGKALRWLSKLAGLVVVTQRDSVLLTTSEREFQLAAKPERVYDVRDIVQGVGLSGESMTEFLSHSITPGKWGKAYGTDISYHEGKLAVTHTSEAQRVIQQFLADYRRAGWWLGSGDRAPLQRRLGSFEFKGGTLDEFLEILSAKSGVPMEVDSRHVTTPTNIGPMRVATAEQAFRFACGPRLDYVVKDGRVTVTTREGACRIADKVRREYDVSDLLKSRSLDELIRLVTTRVSPNTWGGEWGTSVRQEKGKLVITHIDRVHDEIALHLRCLRMAIMRGEKDYPFAEPSSETRPETRQ